MNFNIHDTFTPLRSSGIWSRITWSHSKYISVRLLRSTCKLLRHTNCTWSGRRDAAHAEFQFVLLQNWMEIFMCICRMKGQQNYGNKSSLLEIGNYCNIYRNQTVWKHQILFKQNEARYDIYILSHWRKENIPFSFR